MKMKIFGLTSVSPGYHMVKKIDGKIEVFHPSILSIYYAKKIQIFLSILIFWKITNCHLARQYYVLCIALALYVILHETELYLKVG